MVPTCTGEPGRCCLYRCMQPEPGVHTSSLVIPGGIASAQICSIPSEMSLHARICTGINFLGEQEARGKGLVLSGSGMPQTGTFNA